MSTLFLLYFLIAAGVAFKHHFDMTTTKDYSYWQSVSVGVFWPYPACLWLYLTFFKKK